MGLVLWGSVLSCDTAVEIRGQGRGKVRAQSDCQVGAHLRTNFRGESEAMVRVIVRISVLLDLDSQTLIRVWGIVHL